MVDLAHEGNDGHERSGRRRSWPEALKQEIVCGIVRARRVLSLVARRFDLSDPAVLAVTVAAESGTRDAPPRSAMDMIEIEAGGYRVGFWR
jgi:transposase-like protein